MMDKQSLISYLRSNKNIDILSDRTFDEVTTAALPLYDCCNEGTVTKFVEQVFRSMAGQVRHDVSARLKSALENQS